MKSSTFPLTWLWTRDHICQSSLLLTHALEGSVEVLRPTHGQYLFIALTVHIVRVTYNSPIHRTLDPNSSGKRACGQFTFCPMTSLQRIFFFFLSVELAMCKLSFLLFPSSCFPVSGNNLWFGNGNALIAFKELKACHTRSVHWIHLICSHLSSHDQYLVLQKTT